MTFCYQNENIFIECRLRKDFIGHSINHVWGYSRCRKDAAFLLIGLDCDTLNTLIGQGLGEIINKNREGETNGREER